MKKIKVRAHAKVNLFLEVLGKRRDGYHEVETVLQSIDLWDELTFSPSDSLRAVYTKGATVLADKDLVLKAAELLRREAGIKEGAQIILEKNIPAGSGLGGASADAAASLVALNAMWQLDLPLPFLHSLAVQLGADVPFFLSGGTALGRGKGEKLEAVATLPFCYLAVAKPSFEVLTVEAYGRVDTFARELRNSSSLIRTLEKGDLKEIGKHLHNAFEAIMAEWHPEIMALKGKALQEGALGALMTGSGSAVFAIASDEESAQKVASKLSSFCPSVIVTTSYPRGLDLWN